MASPARKSPSRQKGTRTNLEIFVLAAVRAGLDSAYDLNKYADISVGASLPLLIRLKGDGLLRSQAAARRSKQYSLTALGKAVLERSWRNLVAEVPREFEAILRVAYVAAIMDSTLKTTRPFLRIASSKRKQLAAERERDGKSILTESGRDNFGRGHRWLRAHSDSVRLKAEGALLSRLAGRKDLADALLPKRHSEDVPARP
jgi:DNA-binding PadR family transcriptional regulator